MASDSDILKANNMYPFCKCTVLVLNKYDKEDQLFASVEIVPPLPPPPANTAVMVTALPSLLLFLLCVWNVEADPKIADGVGGADPNDSYKKLGLLSLFLFTREK